jgi:hypothetical protein
MEDGQPFLIHKYPSFLAEHLIQFTYLCSPEDLCMHPSHRAVSDIHLWRRNQLKGLVYHVIPHNLLTLQVPRTVRRPGGPKFRFGCRGSPILLGRRVDPSSVSQQYLGHWCMHIQVSKRGLSKSNASHAEYQPAETHSHQLWVSLSYRNHLPIGMAMFRSPVQLDRVPSKDKFNGRQISGWG